MIVMDNGSRNGLLSTGQLTDLFQEDPLRCAYTPRWVFRRLVSDDGIPWVKDQGSLHAACEQRVFSQVSIDDLQKVVAVIFTRSYVLEYWRSQVSRAAGPGQVIHISDQLKAVCTIRWTTQKAKEANKR